MKKIIVLFITVAMLLSVCAVTIGALTVTPYEDFKNVKNGQLNPDKHAVIQAGDAGGASDNVKFEIFSCGDDHKPTIDGVCGDDEGYITFENFDDYLYIASYGDNSASQDTFEKWYNWVADWDLVVKSCWDGTYLYMYFEYSMKDYVCTPSEAGGLWEWSCIQMGIGNRNASHGGYYSETGYGVSSETGESLATSWAGKFSPMYYSDNRDYQGTMNTNEDTGVTHLTHEFRIDLMKALDRTEPVPSGEEIKMCWVIIEGNNPQNFVSFCHGITGEESWKVPEHFGIVKLSGDVKYTPPVDNNYYTPTEDDIELGYHAPSSIFFADIVDINDFSAENVTDEYIDSEDVKFQRITNNGEGEANYTSAMRFPISLAPMNSDVKFALIRYRTNDVTSLNLNFIGTSHTDEDGNRISDFDPKDAVTPSIISPIVADGEWHYAFYDLEEYFYWEGVINRMAFVIPKGTIDIECIRFYVADPSDIYENEGEGFPEITTTTEAAATTTEATTTTTAAVTTEAATTAPDTTNKPGNKNNGCKSAVASAAIVVTSIAAAWALKKKH